MPALKILLGLLFVAALAVISSLILVDIRAGRRERRYARLDQAGYSPRVREIVGYMEQHHTDHTFDITALAGLTGMERDDIREILANELETTFERMLEQMRVRSAKKLLRESDDSLRSVAKAGGFADYDAFVKIFSYHAGVAPDEWREMRREENGTEEETR
ncbi:MAG: helix-turn-helix domain-containing protein [Chitinivibrionales bacterium]|nr:helix-turn-helix domain-containing protein [Chitinivibrionales bacterium]